MNTWKVGRYDLVPATTDDNDERGLVKMFEPPRDTADYILGVDPTVGVTGWNRYLRTQDDVKIDNAAVEVLRCGNPNVQVAEYAAPIDAEDLAIVVNALGRIYGGRHEEHEALAIIEVYPGMGLTTQRELISRFGYTNIFVWQYVDTFAPTQTAKLGWYSSPSSRKMLWSRGMRHIHKKGVVINSPWLVEEMADCTPDNFLAFTARAQYGAHDDRVVAFLLALWAANQWSLAVEPTEAASAETGGRPDWQKTDVSLEAMREEWDARFSELSEE